MAQLPVADDRRCTATAKTTGERCKKAAIVGGTVCRKHGGAAGQVKRKAGERQEEKAVLAAAARLGIRVEVDPGEALLAALYSGYGLLRYYEERVEQLGPGEVYGSLFRAGSKDREPTPTGEAKRHILVQMLEDAQERVARIAALALRAGVEERRVKLAEADARALATEVIGALADIGAPAELAEQFKAALGARLRARALTVARSEAA